MFKQSGSTSGPRLEQAPGYLHRMYHPGYVYTPKGTFGYLVQDSKLISDQKLKILIDHVKESIATDPQFKDQMNAFCGTENKDSKGCVLGVAEEKVVTQMSPLNTANHRKAFDFLRSWISTIETLSESHIIENMLETHRLMIIGIMNDPFNPPGSYRQEDMLVFSDDPEERDRSIPGLATLLRKNGGSKNDVKILKQFFNSENPEMTDEARRVLSLIAFVPCSPQDVPEKMRQFIKDWKMSLSEMKRCGNVDPIALAAYVHHQIGTIHPFGDGNGRMARALMNAILMEHGIEPVVFLNDPQYTKAIETNDRQEGSFSRYIQEAAKYLPTVKRNLKSS